MLNLLLIFGLGRSPYSSNTLGLPLCSPSISFCQTGKRKGNLHLCPNSSTPPSRGCACLWVLSLCLEDKGEGFELSLYLLKPTPSEYYNYSGIFPQAPLRLGARKTISQMGLYYH